MPYRQFVSGEVLTASNVMNYLANQAVITCATAASRPTSPTTGMVIYQQDTKTLQVYDGTGWQQIYPIISAGITDGAVSTIDIADGSITPAKLTNGSGAFGVDISGNAATCTLASNSALLGGLPANTGRVASTIAVRDSSGNLLVDKIIVNGNISNSLTSSGSYTYLGEVCMRVNNLSDVYSQVVTGRAVQVNSNGTLGTTASSRRYKEEIEPLAVTVEDVLAIEPVSFRYKAEALEPDSERPLEFGVIAEQVDEIGIEPLIIRDGDGRPEAFAYEKLPVLLLKVCREQQARINDLEARLAALEAKVN